MKPHVISHMMESVDGRIDCAMTEQIEPSNVYYDALDQLACPATLLKLNSLERMGDTVWLRYTLKSE